MTLKPISAMHFFWTLLLLASAATYAQTAPETKARPDAWTVTAPYPDNPLKRAILAGTVTTGDKSAEAEQQIECAPDGGEARLRFLFPADRINFDVDPFEGPDGLGGTHALLSLALAGTAAKAHNFSGFFVEHNIFVLEFAPTQAEIRALISSPGKIMTTVLKPASGKGNPLRLTFTLPNDNAPIQTLTAPCKQSK